MNDLRCIVGASFLAASVAVVTAVPLLFIRPLRSPVESALFEPVAKTLLPRRERASPPPGVSFPIDVATLEPEDNSRPVPASGLSNSDQADTSFGPIVPDAVSTLNSHNDAQPFPAAETSSWAITYLPIDKIPPGTPITQISTSCQSGPVEPLEMVERPALPKKLDLVFLIDNSLSMAQHQAGIAATLPEACRNLEGRGHDVLAGGMTFPLVSKHEVDFPETFGDFRSWDRVGFGPGLPNSNVLDSFPESAFRPDATRIFVVIADDDNHRGNPAIDRPNSELQARFGRHRFLTWTTEGNNARPLATALGGMNLPLPSDGRIDLGKVHFADLVASGRLLKVRHRLPAGEHRIVVSTPKTSESVIVDN